MYFIKLLIIACGLLVSGRLIDDIPDFPEIDFPEIDEEPEYIPARKIKPEAELNNMDGDHEPLVRLQGGQQVGPGSVIVQNMAVVAEGRDDVVLDLTGDLGHLRTVVLKEGTYFKIKITFKVQHGIVSRLKYQQVVTRTLIQADKQSYMMGSYGPKQWMWTSPPVESPEGMIYRGRYKVKSEIFDDKTIYLKWEWNLDIKKDWE